MRARLAVFVGLSLMGSAALAAQQQVPTKVLLVKNPPSGGVLDWMAEWYGCEIETYN